MKIKAYQIYSLNNKIGVEEPVCTCLDMDIAKIRFKDITNGKYKFLTAKPPYGTKIIEFDYDVNARDNLLF